MQAVCSIFFHNYYGMHQHWMDFFIDNIRFPANLYYNINSGSMYNSQSTEPVFPFNYRPGANKYLVNIVVRYSPNKGKDIGGKLVLLDAYQKLDNATDYGLFLHDKKSPQKANNQAWADKLLQIAGPAFSEKALHLLDAQSMVGIVTAAGTVTDDYDYRNGAFTGTNQLLLQELQQRFAVYPAGYSYVSGTMFWFRIKPLMEFFEKHPPLLIREMLENGNVTDESIGTYTHCWERLFCWIITSKYQQIKTI